MDRACHARRYVAAAGTDLRGISFSCRRPPLPIARPWCIARPWPRAEPKTRACFCLTQMPASGPRPGSGIARSRRSLDGTLAPGGSAWSTSPGQPEPQVIVLFVRLVVVAARRTRVPSIVVEGTAPPHVMTAFRVRVYQGCPARRCASKKFSSEGACPLGLPHPGFSLLRQGKSEKNQVIPPASRNPRP